MKFMVIYGDHVTAAQHLIKNLPADLQEKVEFMKIATR